jgi:hypothetical protein
MPQPTFDVIDNLNDRLPAPLKWGLAGMGAAAGFAYAQRQGSSLPARCVVAGAALGFGLILVVISGLKLLKHVGVAVAALVVLNYAVLIPFGYGNQMPRWLGWAQAAGVFILGTITRLANDWVQGLR